MGPLMGATVILTGAASYVPLLSILSIVCYIAVPALAFVMLRRGFAEDNCRSTFSSLWLQGICTFFFGGLLMAVIVFAALRWIWPGYISDQMNLLLEILSQSSDPAAAEWIDVIERLKSTGNLPTPIQIVLELIYMVVFTGSLLSMLLSMVVRARRRPSQTPPPFEN